MGKASISQIKSKLESGIFPMDLSFKEREIWSQHKASQAQWGYSDESPVNQEKLEGLYQWLNTPED